MDKIEFIRNHIEKLDTYYQDIDNALKSVAQEEIKMALQYVGLNEINGSLVVLDHVKGASYDEMVEIQLKNPAENRLAG